LSNANSDQVIDRIFTSEQQKIFDSITLSHHVGMTKPDIQMYEVIAQKLEVKPSECVFIDDQERHAAGARLAGMRALIYVDMIQLKHELQTLLSNS